MSFTSGYSTDEEAPLSPLSVPFSPNDSKSLALEYAYFSPSRAATSTDQRPAEAASPCARNDVAHEGDYLLHAAPRKVSIPI